MRFHSVALARYSFNGGPGNCPAKRVRRDVTGRILRMLNAASMEGRAIARPNGTEHAARSPEGVCNASMEGRAIARPNRVPRHGAQPARRHGFNGGPGNCPAKQGSMTSTRHPAQSPQLPGQTRSRVPVSASQSSFNGGPGNCPAKHHRRSICLQRPLDSESGFNGGPGNCPAKRRDSRTGAEGDGRVRCASMEGRAIARPNRSSKLVRLTCPFAGVCERSWKRELQGCLDCVVKLHLACNCKASSGP